MNLLRIKALLGLLVRHASSYAELAVAAAAEYRVALARRLVLLAVGVVTALAGLFAAWATGLVALWDTPWRLAYVGGSALLLLLVAGTSLYYALSARSPGPSGGVLRSELRKDMELLQEWKRSL
ncbi:MAG TPA: hypothetical protein VNQ32_06810 [Steroidobacteraceae bacterium]|nr:hypothetical protein [Steroidobacteraceae bacterium]